MRLMWRASAVFLAAVTATLVMAAQSGAPTPATPAAPQPALTALGQLEPGQWQIESKGRPTKLVCLFDGSELIQLEHEQTGCSRLVVANEPKVSTVHYACEGAGWGRTVVRIETPQVAQVQTQGISHNAPFDFTARAHRVGACTAAATAHSH